VTIGSGIVLPATYTQWDMKKLRMVVAHERSHVRQLDFYLQLLAGVYAAAFWFSPLGWWLRRTLSTLGEAIGDRAGMDAAASRSRYAEVLLEFAAMPPQNLPGVAMARPGNLTRRIERLLNDHLFRSAFAEGKRRAVVSLLLIPAALFAATALVRVQSAAAQTAPAPPTPPAAPAPAVAPGDPAAPADPTPEAPAAVPMAGVPAPAPIPGVPVAAPAPVAPVIAPSAPDTPMAFPDIDIDAARVLAAQAASNAYSQAQKGYAYAFSNGGESYAIVDGEGSNVTFSGSWDDDRRDEIDAARKIAKGPFLWFTHDGKSYIVTDPAVLERIRTMYKPIEELGRKQGALGKQQE
jgi:hypothetical protein